VVLLYCPPESAILFDPPPLSEKKIRSLFPAPLVGAYQLSFLMPSSRLWDNFSPSFRWVDLFFFPVAEERFLMDDNSYHSSLFSGDFFFFFFSPRLVLVIGRFYLFGLKSLNALPYFSFFCFSSTTTLPRSSGPPFLFLLRSYCVSLPPLFLRRYVFLFFFFLPDVLMTFVFVSPHSEDSSLS